jgi:type VI secretion system protein
MKAGLYDILRGKYYDGQIIETVPEDEQRLRSVMSNLRRLFNARQDSIDHIPDYGLPDLNGIYRERASRIEELRRSIEEIVRKYEPRLSNISVNFQPTDAEFMRLVFNMKAKLDKKHIVRFQTTFSSKDLVDVMQVKRDY